MSPRALVTATEEPLLVSLWDFTWYTRTGPGEPFEDLDRAFAQARERGYDTVRICAMPFLLFRSGLDTSALRLGPLGGDYGQRVRWYDVRRETTIDARAHLLELFRAADRHDVGVIASSWEYQQSPSFARDPGWYEALHAVDPEDRAVVLADAHADLVDLLEAEGLAHRLVLTELHNEVQVGYLTDGLGASGRDEAVRALTPRLERGIARFRERRPDRPVTVDYAGVPVGALSALPRDLDALVVHPYVYGVLGELVETFGLRGPLEDFDVERVRPLLRPGAPDPRDWSVPPGQEWRTRATIMARPEVYVHDWCDPDAWDRWLYDRWANHRLAMEQKLTLWLEVAADAAAARGIPLLLGEGYVGYTPLHGRFEEGPVGAELCRHALREARRLGVRGAVVCSNAAPHHPMWSDVALQQECAAIFTGREVLEPVV
ncbi:cellulase-like family protein [Puerhibacterium puerhi]|uniref:cellulase-like family protein n=1 Tax=Puerhibacterium puerhi TaxID=2692623 RepID=UPI00135BFB3A|nr:cellulase-like family protein [Puerhibacterium puerhi]